MKKPFAVALLVILFFVLISVGSGSSAQTDEKDAPQTLIKSARFLEQKPLEKDAKKVREWAMQWLIVTDKVSVTMCSLILSGVDKKYKYSSELLAQYTIAMGAYKLANPDKAQDEDAAQQAGIESALVAYEAMVTEQAKAKNAFMDELVAKRSQGMLAAYVKENNCKDKK